jgi:uncharacterized protein
MKLRTTLIAALLCTAFPAMAQTPNVQPVAPQHASGTTAQSSEAKPADQTAPPEKIDPAKEAAIRHLMEITEVSKMGDNINTAITSQVHNVMGRAIPPDQLPKFMETFSQKFTANAPPSAVTDAIVPVYAKHFSLEDIQSLTKFYETPLGREVVKVMPEVAQESQQAGAQIDQKAAIAVLRNMSDEYPQLKQMLPPDPSAPPPAASSSPAPALAPGTPPSSTPAPAPKLSPPQPQH